MLQEKKQQQQGPNRYRTSNTGTEHPIHLQGKDVKTIRIKFLNQYQEGIF